MKKVLLIMAALMMVTSLFAQDKPKSVKSLDKAIEASVNPKKSENPSTWIKLSDAYIKVYEAERNGLSMGIPRNMIRLEGLVSSNVENINGVDYLVETYPNKVLYYNEDILNSVIITESFLGADQRPIKLAIDALLKAIEVDPTYKKADAIEGKLLSIRNLLIADADAAYRVNNIKETNFCYETAQKCYDNTFMNMVDSMMVYYTALTAQMLGDKQKALQNFEKCIEIDYTINGDVFAQVAEIYLAENNPDKAKEVLNQGLQRYPSNQVVLINLINAYMSTNDDTEKIVTLLKAAQENEPNNATLYMAEGNLHKERGDMESALAAYKKSYEVDPNNGWGIFSEGALYFDRAVDIQAEMANVPLDDYKTYDKLSAEFLELLKKSIEPFELAFTKSENDNELRLTTAEVLKQIYFRFRDDSPEFKEKFDKYSKIAAGQ